MIGQATAALASVPKRWLRRAWGIPYVQKRQDWHALWPHLRELPVTPRRLLDAGCGEGIWTLELAARRPAWTVVGVDRGPVDAAERARLRLRLDNAAFVQSDFLAYEPSLRFDVVISVYSAHYLFEASLGDELLRQVRRWLVPGGLLLLLGPRRERDVPFVPWLPRPALDYVLTAEDVARACEAGGLVIETAHGAIGRLGVMAMQLACLGRGRSGERLVQLSSYPLRWALAAADARRQHESGATFAWLVAARAPRADRDPAAA